MKNLKITISTGLLILSIGCTKRVTVDEPIGKQGARIAPVLLFKTGFNNSTLQPRPSDPSNADIIVGNNEPGFGWTTSPIKDNFKIYYESGTNSDRKAFIVPDDIPNQANNIMKYSIWDAKKPITFGTYRFKQRVQADLFDFKDPVSGSPTYGKNLKEFYQTVDIKFNAASLNRLFLSENANRLTAASSDWLNFFEEFNGVTDFTNNATSYRVGLGLEKSSDGTKFILKATGEQGTATDWIKGAAAPNWELSTQGSGFFVTPGKWYKVEIYLKSGKASTGTGRFWLAITDKLTNAKAYLGSKDLARTTQSEADNIANGFRYIYPMKLYTSGDLIKAVNPGLRSGTTPLQASFDNYEFYNTYR